MKEKVFREIPRMKGIGNRAGLRLNISVLHVVKCSLDLERHLSTRNLSDTIFGVIA